MYWTLPRFIALWFIANVFPAIFCWHSYEENIWQYFSQDNVGYLRSSYAWLLGLTLSLTILEGVAICAVGYLIFRRWNAGKAGAVAATFFFSLLALYEVIIFADWNYFGAVGSFIDFNSLGALRFLEDFGFLRSVVTSQQFAAFMAGLAAAIVLTWFVYSCAKDRSTSRIFLKEVSAVLLLSTTTAAICTGGLHTRVNVEHYELLSSVTAYGLTPQWSLIWQPVLLSSRVVEDVAPKSLELTPFEPPKTYAKRQQIKRTPNVLILLIEGLRLDSIVPFGGDPEIMPHLNRLAVEGVVLRGYAPAPETSETVLSILTSTWPLRAKQRDTKRSWDFSFGFVYDILAQFGYRAGFFGETWATDAALIESSGLSVLFDPQYANYSRLPADLNPRNYSTPYFGAYSPAISDRAKMYSLKKFIKENSANNRPSFATVYLMSSHFPYEQTAEINSKFIPTEITKDESFLGYPASSIQPMLNRYKNTLNFIDSELGELIAFLEHEKLASDTILIVSGDHGEMFGEHGRFTHGGSLYEEAIATPLVLWPSEIFKAVRPGAASLIDIAPTILSVLGLEPFPAFQGTSLTRSIKAIRPIYITVQMLAREDALIQWPLKLTVNRRTGAERLNDISSDPGELINLISTDSSAATELKSCLDEFRQRQLYFFSGNNKKRLGFNPPIDNCAGL